MGDRAAMNLALEQSNLHRASPFYTVDSEIAPTDAHRRARRPDLPMDANNLGRGENWHRHAV